MKLHRFPTAIVTALTIAALAAIARADPTIEQLKASYDETVRQLQQSQDRKNQLANENEQLKAKVAELQGKLNAIDAQARQAEFLRGQYVAWQTFIERYPLLLKRFQTFAGARAPVATVATPEPFFDPEWPFSAAARIEETGNVASASSLVQMFHGGPNHWCALCAAAAARKAEADKPTGDVVALPAAGDLMQDLPLR